MAPPRVVLPRIDGRLHAEQLGLVINTADPYSIAVGEYYAQQRQLRPEQVLRVELPVRDALSPAEFETLREQVADFFGPQIQALALAWTQPWAVGCNSITGALALGYDGALCAHSCQASRPSGYLNSASRRPFSDLGWRPSMLLAAVSVEAGKRLVDRGVAADGTAGRRGAPSVVAWFMPTTDRARNVRAALFPPPGRVMPGLEIRVQPADAGPAPTRLILLQTGLARMPGLDELSWAPGALADHLTSYGGQLTRASGQTTALQWLSAGATASYGTVSEPCNHLQKFPHPQLLLGHYLQGATAIEAYWKSVAWPQQGLFVGEPLAAPFARDSQHAP